MASILLLGLTLAGGGNLQPLSGQTPVRLPLREGFIPVSDSVRLFYRSIGAGPDTVVVLHGGPGFHSNLMVPDLTPLGAYHTVLFYDQRGAGRSTLLADSAQMNARHLISDLEALRRHFKLEKITLLGHSWGGLLAGLYAAEHPDRVKRMILVAPVGPTAESMRGFNPNARLDSLSNLVRAANLKAWRDGRADSTKACWDYYALFARGYYARPELARRMWGDPCNVPQAAMLHALRSYPQQSLGAWDVRSRFGQLKAPVLIIYGDQDPVPAAAVNQWIGALPSSRLLTIPQTGHFPHVDRPAPFFTAVETFLEGTWPDSSVLSASGAAVVRRPARGRAPTPYQATRAAIAAVQDALVEALNGADWTGAAEIYAEDAMIFAPGAPPAAGRQAIAAFWRTAAARGLRTVELQLMDVDGVADEVIATGKYVIRDSRAQPIDIGKFLAVYRRVGGSWKLHRDIFNSALETRSPLEVPDYLSVPVPQER